MIQVSNLEALVDNWLKDVQRRGMELYALNRGNNVLYVSFERKDRLRFSLEVDFTVENVKVEITGPQWSHIERKSFLLNRENLRSMAKKMCPVSEGQAIVPVHLLAQLSILCHAYQRLLEDYDREHGIHTITDTVKHIDSELGSFLTSDEQKRTDNPILNDRRLKAKSSNKRIKPFAEAC
jgi:hypothetical protein